MSASFTDIIDALSGEQARAQAIVDACAQAIAALTGSRLPDPPSLPVVPAAVAVVPRERRKAARPAANEEPARSARSGDPKPAVPSKSGVYRAAIVAYLKRWDTAENCADSTVIRREVAKACKVDAKKDDKFAGDISNALYGLKRDGLVERTGNVWALTEAGKAAA